MASASPHGDRRAFGPGDRRVGRVAVLAIALAAAVAAGLAASSGSSTGSAANESRYGGLPRWLPSSTVTVGRVVQASESHPWLAIEGDTVVVHLGRGQVTATAVGPAVPEEGRFPVPRTTPCSFTLTFTQASGSVPIDPASFTILDELGHLHRPQLTAPGKSSAASAVAPGRTVTIVLKDVLPTGNGQLRWAPDGGRPIVSWDFDVEID